MNAEPDWNNVSILPRTLGLDDKEDRRERRDMLLLRAGGRTLGIFADEADNVTEGLRPTPLPHAPPAVLGIACVRGRMRTVLDPVVLLEAGARTQSAHAFIVSLRGDEQLALAVERAERIVEVFTEEVQTLAHTNDLVRGVLRHDNTTVVILNPRHLFDAAVEGTERRRQRS